MKAKLKPNPLFGNQTNYLEVDGKPKICPYQPPIMVQQEPNVITRPNQASVIPMFINCGDHCPFFIVEQDLIGLKCSSSFVGFTIETPEKGPELRNI